MNAASRRSHPLKGGPRDRRLVGTASMPDWAITIAATKSIGKLSPDRYLTEESSDRS